MPKNENGDAGAECDVTINVTDHVPTWALRPIQDFLADAQRLRNLVDLSSKGIRSLRGIPDLMEAFAKSEGSEKFGEEAIGRAHAEAKLAQAEIDEGFPVLHAQAAVTLWSFLEAAVRRFVIAWLRNSDNAMDAEKVGGLKITLGEYVSLDHDDRCSYIVDLLEKSMATSLRGGVNRYEELLKVFGLGGPLGKEVRQRIFELGNIRNAVVHNAGQADKKLIDACPQLRMESGERIMLGHDGFERYCAAVMCYAVEITARLVGHFGGDGDDVRKVIPDELR